MNPLQREAKTIHTTTDKLIEGIQTITNSIPQKLLTIQNIHDFILLNRTFILSQTENPITAPDLQNALLKLSKRISETKDFDTPAGRRTAFDIMAYGQGIFKKIAGSGMLSELWEHILLKLTEEQEDNENRTISNLLPAAQVSKKWNTYASKAKQAWVNKNGISASTYHCHNFQDGAQLVTAKHLKSANFSDFVNMEKVKQAELDAFVDANPQITHLALNFYNNSNIKNLPFSKFTDLKSVKIICVNNINEEMLVEALSKFSGLEELEITSSNMLEGAKFAPILAKQTNLKRLSFAHCGSLKDPEIWESIAKLKKLESLDLTYCFMIDLQALMYALLELENLKHLILGSCAKLNVEVLHNILQSHPKLTRLVVSTNFGEFGDPAFTTSIASLQKLEYLDISECRPETAVQSATAIAKLSKLQTLIFSYPEKQVINALKNHPSLTYLQITSSFEIGSEVKDLLQGLPHLKHVILGRMNLSEENLTDSLLSNPQLEYLESLDFSGQYKYTSEQLSRVFPYFSRMTSLKMGRCFKYSMANLVESFQFLTKLRYLDISYSSITDEDMAKGFPKLKEIRTINLTHCTGIKGTTMEELIPKLTNLVTIILEDCSGLKKEQLQAWREKFPWVNFKATRLVEPRMICMGMGFGGGMGPPVAQGDDDDEMDVESSNESDMDGSNESNNEL